MGPSEALARSPSPPAVAAKVFTVAEIVGRIRAVIEHQFPAAVWVEGELSNCSFPASGHIYFSLADERATDRFPGPPGAKAAAGGQRLVLPCAFFKGANQHLQYTLEDGMKVLCLGQVTTYEGRGQYQLRVLRVELRGIGALQQAFEQLKKRLQAEGLFAEARKRPIPALPERVGLITSPSGSVVHDMVARLRGLVDLIIVPVRVQGEGAAQEVADAIGLANRTRVAEVLIVARGGGSLEELWAFNDERVARAIVASDIPVISAVGHEDHWTIADYVADLRASTPTHAAQQLAEDRRRLVREAQDLTQQLLESMGRWLEDQAQSVDDLSERLRLLHPSTQLGRYRDKVQELQGLLVQGTRFALERSDHAVQGLAGRLEALSPLAVLARGYSITMKLPEGRVVSAASSVREGDELQTLLAAGRVRSRVTGCDVASDETPVR